MFDLTCGSSLPLLDSADQRREAASIALSGVPCRIAAGARDMTCGDRVLELFDCCRRALRAGARHVIIDLNLVTAADTKIVACLVALHQIARSGAARLEVHLSQSVLQVAEVCRLERLVQELETSLRGGVAPTSRSA